MNIEIQARIQEIGQIEQVSDKFSKLTVIVETSDQYPQTFDIEIHKGKTEFLDKYKAGDEVIFDCDLRGRRWFNGTKDFYFKTLVSWKQRSTRNAYNPPKMRGNEDGSADPNEKYIPLGSLDHDWPDPPKSTPLPENDLPF